MCVFEREGEMKWRYLKLHFNKNDFLQFRVLKIHLSQKFYGQNCEKYFCKYSKQVLKKCDENCDVMCDGNCVDKV